MSRIFYVNGDYVAEENAVISVLDRGFLFADAVYEVTSVLNGKLIDNDAHLKRLHRSLGELRIRSPLPDAEIVDAQLELIKRNDLDQGLIYLQVSRGAADRDFGFPADHVSPSLVLFTQKKNLLEDPLAQQGISIISVEDIRWKRRDIKTVGLLGPCLAKQAARDAGVDDAWMVEDGLVTEGSSNNAYIVHENGDIQTRQLGSEILSGVTRKAILALCDERGTTVIEKPFSIDQVKSAKEAFITSASSFVTPVVNVDGQPIGHGRPGPLAIELRERYVEFALAL